MNWEPPAGAPNNFGNGERSQKQFLKKVANKVKWYVRNKPCQGGQKGWSPAKIFICPIRV